jgi:hypothetical protein
MGGQQKLNYRCCHFNEIFLGFSFSENFAKYSSNSYFPSQNNADLFKNNL